MKSIFCLKKSIEPRESLCSLILLRSLFDYTFRTIYIAGANDEEIEKFTDLNRPFFKDKTKKHILKKILEQSELKYLKKEKSIFDKTQSGLDYWWDVSCAFVHGDIKSFKFTWDAEDRGNYFNKNIQGFVVSLVYLGYSSLLKSCKLGELEVHEIHVPVSEQFEKIVATT